MQGVVKLRGGLEEDAELNFLIFFDRFHKEMFAI